MSDDGTTVGIWVGPDEDIAERFDDLFEDADSYSRSDKIKDAMEMYITVQRVIDDLEYDLDSEVVKRSWVRQALLDRAQREAENDS